MKILHVLVFFSVRQGGGTSDLVYKLAKAQQKRGHEVTVYAGDYKYDAEYARSLKGVRVRVFKSWVNFGFYIMPGLLLAARREVGTFDIIHLHCYRSFQNIVIYHYAQKHGVPYVLSAHGSVPKYMRKRGIKAAFDRLLGLRILKGATRLVADTETGVEEYRKVSGSAERVSVVPLPFSVEEFSTLPPRGSFRVRFGIREDHLIVFLGRIHWIKGLDFLVKAFRELRKRRDDVVLAIVGPDDGYERELRRLIDGLGLANKILFTGFLSGEQKLAALVDADVLIQPSRHEHAAWASLEALLCNTPVVVTKNTGSAEEISRIGGGYLVEFGDVLELARIVEGILENPGQARNRAKKAGEYIREQLSMAGGIRDLEKLYEACIEEKRLGRGELSD